MALENSLLVFITMSTLLLSSPFHVSGRKALAPSPDGGDDSGVEIVDGPGVTTGSLPDVQPGFTILNTEDPQVIALARYALDDYNKGKEESADLVYVTVFDAVSTDDRAQRATNYDLVVSASIGNGAGRENQYAVKMVVGEGGVKKIVSFEQIVDQHGPPK